MLVLGSRGMGGVKVGRWVGLNEWWGAWGQEGLT